MDFSKNLSSAKKTLAFLKRKKKVLFLTTSTRSGSESGEPVEAAKSGEIARLFASRLKNVKIIDVPSLKIYFCEGNISMSQGNLCGAQSAALEDKNKNPSKEHRCWASKNHPDDELWKISRELLTSDCVVFFASVRWGQANAMYQRLIERLSWLENRHTTLGETNILAKKESGMILTGHNWNGKKVLATERQVLKYFGFKVPAELFWNWEFTNPDDETKKGYIDDAKEFAKFLKELKKII